MLVLPLAVCAAELEFAGYMTTPDSAKFVIKHAQSGKSSGWISVGGTFEGYVLEHFDQKGAAVLVRSKDGVLRLPLRRDSVQPEERRTDVAPAPTAELMLTLNMAGYVSDPEAMKERLREIRKSMTEVRIDLYPPKEADELQTTPFNVRDAFGWFYASCDEIGLKIGSMRLHSRSRRDD
jgi:hypothetical protein